MARQDEAWIGTAGAVNRKGAGVISIDVRSDQVLGFMERFSKQAPFAISLGINRLTELAMAAAGKGIKARMIVRVPKFTLPPQQLPTKWRATKEKLFAVADIAYDDGPGSIGARRRAILSKFEEGGRKRSVDPTFPIAIPTKALRPSPTDLVARKMYPRNLVGGFDQLGVFVGLGRKARTRGKRQKSIGRYFVLGQQDDPFWGLYERTGPSNIRKLWKFTTQIPIPAILHYQADITRTVEQHYDTELRAAMDYAIATAK